MFKYPSNVIFSTANGTATIAYPQKDGSFKLNGYKWFTSATDADITFTLARIIDNKLVINNKRIIMITFKMHLIILYIV